MTDKYRTKLPHKPTRATRELATLHTMAGTIQKTIASIIGIDPKTLRKRHREEFDQSKAKANATIGGALLNKAKSGEVYISAAIDALLMDALE